MVYHVYKVKRGNAGGVMPDLIQWVNDQSSNCTGAQGKGKREPWTTGITFHS